MRSHAAISLRDGELEITLPAAVAAFHVDDGSAPWTAGWEGPKADWVWCEPARMFLCELKDPECSGAMLHPPAAGLPHAARILAELSSRDFPNEFARLAVNSLERLEEAGIPASVYGLPAAPAVTLVVLVAVSDPSFDAVISQTAANLIEQHLAGLGRPMPVVVVNLAAWNSELAPRRVNRPASPRPSPVG